MYLRYLKFEFFEIRPHPRISLALERYAVAVHSRRAALVYEKQTCLVNCMYLYVLVRTFQGILYWYVPVCTGMYRYVPVHTILPDPASGILTTWTGLGKPVHTCLNMVQTCMYMFTHVHESTNVYVHVCTLNMNTSKCM
jgi:hypothetical protein